MKIYLRPMDGSGRVILCESHTETFAAIEKLRAEGVTQIERTTGDVICDFCSNPVVRWLYQLPTGGAVIQVGEITHGDLDGKWGACDVCKDFIQAGNWDALAVRSMDNFVRLHGDIMPRWMMALSVENAHGYFRNAWDASVPLPVTPDTDFLVEHGIESA